MHFRLTKPSSIITAIKITTNYLLDVTSPSSHETVLHSVKDHISFLDEEIAVLKKEIADLIKKDPDLKGKSDLLRSIPGIGEAAIAAILSELALFENCDRVRKVVAYIGRTPREFTSGSSVKGKPRFSKVGSANEKGPLHALTGIHAIQSGHHQFLSASLKEGGERQGDRLCSHAETRPHHLRRIKVRPALRSESWAENGLTWKTVSTSKACDFLTLIQNYGRKGRPDPLEPRIKI